MNKSVFAQVSCACLSVVLASSSLQAAEEDGFALPTGKDFSIGEVLFPSAHLILSGGDSDGEPTDLAVGAHDPDDNFNVQAIELGLSLRLNDHIQGYANYLFAYGASEEWVDENEEAFLTLKDLPEGWELRGGRLANRFGLLNTVHQHSWTTVDLPLASGRFLGEEHLTTEGADLTWYLPLPQRVAFTVSYGDAREHDHAHGDEHDEHGDEDHDEDEHHDEHEGEMAEEAGFEEDFFTANLTILIDRDDFHRYQVGGSIAQGDNGLGDETLIGGLHLAYTWRENGHEAGGRSFRWNTEVFYRDVGFGEGGHDHEEDHDEHGDEDHDEEEHHDEEGEHGSADEWGLYTEVIYGPTGTLDTGLRISHVDDVDELGLHARTRVSPFATIYFSEARNTHLRLQYNYDDLDEDEAHSVWAQLQYSFGAPEVR